MLVYTQGNLMQKGVIMLNLRRLMESQLPAVPCETNMRLRIEEIATLERVSMAEVLRHAVSLFLADYDNNSTSRESKSRAKETSQ